MFTMDVVIKNHLIPDDKRDELFEKHAQWIQENYDSGAFLLMGPYTTKEMTGLIIGQANSKVAIEAIAQADAFYPDYADYVINEFNINKINPKIAEIK